jgi:hypothetical protein
MSVYIQCPNQFKEECQCNYSKHNNHTGTNRCIVMSLRNQDKDVKFQTIGNLSSNMGYKIFEILQFEPGWFHMLWGDGVLQ